MQKLALIACILLAYSTVSAASLTISVKLPDGKSAKDIAIQILRYGDRDSISKLLGQTDKNGEVKVVFEDKLPGLENYGWGIYDFLVMPKDFKWEYMGRYYWAGTSGYDMYKSLKEYCENKKKDNPNNFYLEKDNDLKREYALIKGRNAPIQFLDNVGKPIEAANVMIGTIPDIWFPPWDEVNNIIKIDEGKTDKNGRYTFKNGGELEYYVRLFKKDYLIKDFRKCRSAYEGQLLNNINEFIYKKYDENDITVRVRDFASKMPIEGAVFCINPDICNVIPVRDTKPIGKTNKNGEFYTNKFKPEEATEFGVRKSGYRDDWRDISSYSPGGKYEFELKKEIEY
jgi:hypothetical protein